MEPMEQPVEEPLEAGAEAEEEGVPLARLPDRFLAYSIDALLFLIPCRLTMKAALGAFPPAAKSFQWQLAWVGAYLVYQTLLNTGGRAPLGKKLFGLRAVTLEGQGLGFGQSLVRAVGGIFSGALLDLGYAWAAFNPLRRTWHDYVAGSVVVEGEERPEFLRTLSAVLAPVVLAAFFLLTLKAFLPKSGTQYGAEAKAGLDYVAGLENSYRARNGRYTESIKDLAAQAGGPRAFRDELVKHLRPDGFGLQADKDSCRIQALTLDGLEVSRQLSQTDKKP